MQKWVLILLLLSAFVAQPYVQPTPAPEEKVVEKVQELAALYRTEGKKVGILTTDESQSYCKADVVKPLGSRDDLTTIARNLFRLLREFDEEKVDVIIAEGITTRDLGLAVMNRLRKAANFNIVNT